MYKIILTLLFSLLSMGQLYSQNLFTEFANMYTGDGEQIKIAGSFINIKDGVEKAEAYSMIKSVDYTLLYFTAKNTKTLFLANNQGFFIQGKNQRSPLKIAGSYTVTGAANTSDVMSFDYLKDYEVKNIISDDEVLLQRIRRDVAYNEALLKRASFGYTIDFIDNSGKSVKRGLYKIGSVSGYRGFNRMEFHNLVISTNVVTIYTTTKIESINISDSFFRSENMGRLFLLFEN